MRKMFQGIKTWSLREEHGKETIDEKAAGGKAGTEIVYAKKHSVGQSDDPITYDAGTQSGGACCVIL